MSMPMMRPKRKNPILRTRVMNLPPSARGRVALGLTAAAAEGRLMLQVCEPARAFNTRRVRLARVASRPSFAGVNRAARVTCLL